MIETGSSTPKEPGASGDVARDPPRPSARRTSRRAAAIVTVAVCLPIIAASQFIAHGRADDRDVYLYMYFGRQLAQGQSLYVDIWDFKPPGVFWASAIGAALSGGSRIGVITVCALTAAATCVLFFAVCRRLFGYTTAAAATIIASVYLYMPVYHAGGLRPSTFMMAVELGALLVYLLAQAKERRLMLASAGFLIVTAMCFKQTAVGLAVAVPCHQGWLLIRHKTSAYAALHTVAHMALGGLAALVLLAGLLGLTSDLLEAWYAVFVYPAHYAAEAGRRWWLPWMEARPHVTALALPLILAVAALAYTLYSHRVRRTTQDPAAKNPTATIAGDVPVLFSTWFLAAFYVAVVTPNRQAHYFAPALVPLTLLAACGVSLLLSQRADGRPRPFSVWVAVLWFAYMILTPLEDRRARLGTTYYEVFTERADRRETKLVDAIQQHCGPDETIYISGYRPRLWYLADRPPAVRHCGAMSAARMGDAGEPIIREIVTGLKRNPPKAIVTGGDELNRLSPPGNSHDNAGAAGSREKVQTIPRWIVRHYDPAPEISNRCLWIRRD